MQLVSGDFNSTMPAMQRKNQQCSNSTGLPLGFEGIVWTMADKLRGDLAPPPNCESRMSIVEIKGTALAMTLPRRNAPRFEARIANHQRVLSLTLDILCS